MAHGLTLLLDLFILTRMMAKKFIVGMIVFVILIFVKVQAMAFTTFHRSSFPILLPHPFKLDIVESLFFICIEEKVEKCKEIIETHPKKSAKCVVESFKQCVEKAPLHDELYFKAMEETNK